MKRCMKTPSALLVVVWTTLRAQAAPVSLPFEPSSSDTFAQPSPAESFTVSFLSSETSSGFIGHDMIAIGPWRGFSAFGGQEMKDDSVDNWPFQGWNGDGIVGFAPGSGGIAPSVLWSLIPISAAAPFSSQSSFLRGSDNKNVGALTRRAPAATLGLLMDDVGGQMFIGEAIPASSYDISGLQIVPVIEDADPAKTIWQLPITGLWVGTTKIFNPPAPARRASAVPANAAVLDTGAGCLGLPNQIFAAFDQAFTSLVDTRPSFRVDFAGGLSISIAFDQYVFVGDDGRLELCVGQAPMIQLGDPFFRSAAVEFLFGGPGKFAVRMASRARTFVSASYSGEFFMSDVLQENESSPIAVRRVLPTLTHRSISRFASSTFRQSSPFAGQKRVRYLIDVGLGSENQTLSLLIDTGSSLLIAYSKSPPSDVALIIGLAVGIPLGLCLAIGSVVGCVWWKKRRSRMSAAAI